MKTKIFIPLLFICSFAFSQESEIRKFINENSSYTFSLISNENGEIGEGTISFKNEAHYYIATIVNQKHKSTAIGRFLYLSEFDMITIFENNAYSYSLNKNELILYPFHPDYGYDKIVIRKVK